MHIIVLVAVLWLSAVEEACADPFITPLVTWAIGSATTAGIGGTMIGGAVIFGSLTVGGLVSGLLTLGLTFGLSLLAAGLKSAPKPENGMIPVQQATPFRALAFGQIRYAGCFVLKEEAAGTLFQVQALLGHRISEFVGLYVHDDQVNVPIASNRIEGNVSEGADGRYAGNTISVDTRLGLVPETVYPIIHGDVVSPGSANISTIWPATCRGDGIASIASTSRGVKSADFSKVYPNYAPALSPIMKTAMVFDPRDVTQDRLDPSTWKYSDNPALAALHYVCHSPFGALKPYERAVAPLSLIHI